MCASSVYPKRLIKGVNDRCETVWIGVNSKLAEEIRAKMQFFEWHTKLSEVNRLTYLRVVYKSKLSKYKVLEDT